MKEKQIDQLVNVALRAAANGAHKYIAAHNLKADADALAECLKFNCKFRLPEALRDAKEAIECNMGQVAEATFIATMTQAGVDAAKECAIPAGNEFDRKHRIEVLERSNDGFTAIIR